MTRPNQPARLQTLRGKRGWSQEELAHVSGVSARTIQRLESGTPPSLETSRAIAAAFDLEPHEVFEAEPNQQPGKRAGLYGAQWGIRGALVGYASAVAAVTYALLSGQASGFEAGTSLGVLGAATGLLCLGITWLSRRLQEDGSAG